MMNNQAFSLFIYTVRDIRYKPKWSGHLELWGLVLPKSLIFFYGIR